MLDALIRIACDERPDVFLVAGDIFDRTDVSAKDQKMFADKIDELNRACPDMTIIMTSGNHDSGSRIEINRTVWSRHNVHLLGVPPTGNEPDYNRYIIPVSDKGWVVAVPHLPYGADDMFFPMMMDFVGERNTQGLPVVLMAHLAIAGCDFAANSSTEEGDVIGNLSVKEGKFLGEGFDYCALGHIHRPCDMQTPSGAWVRYCGTPLAVSFSELAEHTVTIVEISEHGAEPQVRTVPVPCEYELVTIPEDEESAEWGKCLDKIRLFPAERKAYIRLNVSTLPFPDEAAQARAACEGKAARFCEVHHPKPKAVHPGPKLEECATVDLEKLDPIEVARQYFESCKLPWTDECKQMLKEVIEEVHKDETA